MNFLLDYKDGKFSYSYSLSENCWAELKTASGDRHIIRIMRFDCHPKFVFASDVYLRECKDNDGFTYTNVHVGLKNTEDGNSVYFHFDSNKPLCISHSNNLTEAFVCFMNSLYLFDSVEDASTVFSTKNVFDYTNPDELTTKIQDLSKILDKYAHINLFSPLRDRILVWLRKALLRYGYSVEKYNQTDNSFQDVVTTLNSLGYTVTKF